MRQAGFQMETTSAPSSTANDGTEEGVTTSAVGTAMYAADAAETIREVRANALEERERRALRERLEPSRRPRFQRLLWTKGEVGVTPAATYTETAAAVPGVPLAELENEAITNTIRQHPELFKIVTPLKADKLEGLLQSHPNRELIDSLVHGIRDGFWPYADTVSLEGQGGVVKHSHLFDATTLDFLRTQRDVEMSLGRYSQSFGRKLLPGMICQPIFAVPKPGTQNLRLINDHSAGDKSLNSLIPTEGGFVKLDTLLDLGANIRAQMAARGGDAPCYLFKSDVSQAYRRLPMNIRWQARQATEIDGEYHVDRNAVFGNRASGRIWCLLLDCILWAAIHDRGLTDLLAYVDDVYSYDYNPTLQFYAPYGRYMPDKQAELLRLWDEIGLPHEDHKQVFGRALGIIGLTVDLNSMTISLSGDRRAELIRTVREFVDPARRQIPLREWLRMLGYVNWSLNVFPMLKPALNSSWDKVRGKTQMSSPIWINRDVLADLSWFADTVEKLSGVFVLGAESWGAAEADLSIWCDASDISLGFYCPAEEVAFVHERDDDPSMAQSLITFFESLCVLSAIQWASLRQPPPKRLAVHTDSLNSVQFFNSFRARDKYAILIKAAAETLILSNIDLRVFHVSGKNNVVADLLSRRLYAEARSTTPSLKIHHFQPPRDVMGAVH